MHGKPDIEMSTLPLIDEFIIALDEEIKAIKAGKGGAVVRVFDGQFIREDSGIFVYSFTLENFIATIDDAPVEVQVGGSRYQGQIIQTQGLEAIIGVEHDFGPSITEARLITNLYFLHEMLKKKFEAVRNGEASGDFALADLVFEGGGLNLPGSVTLPSLEPHATSNPNDSQLKAIKVSQELPLTLVWGPPGTGKTETLARIVESFIKRGMNALVVAHANAAVDEATEDIAEFLKTTEYYNKGQIIRLGNVQKETLRTQYDLVLPEKIAERLGETLKLEKEQLQLQKRAIEQNLTGLASALETIKEREALSIQTKQLSDALISHRRESTEIRAKRAQQENNLSQLGARLQKAESSGAVKRFFLGLNPVKIQHEIDQATVRLDSTLRQLRERESRLQEIEQQKSGAEARLHTVQQMLGSLLENLGFSEPQVRAREQELNAEKNRILSRISEIQKELDELQKRVLSEARVVCTTLTKTFSAKELPDTPFDVLVVDEASMAPMPYLYWVLGRCRKAAVIVGDFLQLPPICIAEESMAQKWLGRSIYQQLTVDTVEKAKQDKRIYLLDIQYRMNPAIADIPNQMFYQGMLTDDISTRSHVTSEGLTDSPLAIIDTTSASPWCSRLSSGGRFNVYSALLAATTAKRIMQSTGASAYKVGIISPYRHQAKLIRRIVDDMRLDLPKDSVSTIHSFQGGERDIIILDTVEGPGVKVAPMLDDTKKDSDAALLLNVAMTRARCKVFLLANLKYLKSELSPETVLHRIISAFERNGQRIDCNNLVDSYFIRDFERWIERFIELSRTGGVEPPSGSLFTEQNFYPAFFEDLRKAKEEVIILSPFMSTRRSGQFVELFRVLINRGIKVRVFTRSAREQTSDFALNAAQVIEQMQTIGVEVTERRWMHQKVAIIDRSIAWEGSLNILSHRDSDEQMRRLPFATAVNELIRLCELEESSAGGIQGKKEPIRTFEECPECGEEMVIRVSRYGPFLSCPDRSCSGKRNINRWDRIMIHVLCPDTGHPMVLRQGRRGPFLGCSAWPDCKKTLGIR